MELSIKIIFKKEELNYIDKVLDTLKKEGWDIFSAMNEHLLGHNYEEKISAQYTLVRII